MGRKIEKFLERAGAISKRAVDPSNGNFAISVEAPRGSNEWNLNKALIDKYPNILDNLEYVATESPSVRSMLRKGQVSNALLSTMETVQSAYVAPSVSGLGPAKQMLTEWWFNPIWGQPRLVDLRTVKQLARGHIGSMAVEAILDQIMQVEWNIIPKFSHQVDRSADVKQSEQEQIGIVEDFFQDPNRNHDSIEKILRMYMRNILETDDGVIVKVFEEYTRPDQPNVQIASTGDVRAYTAQPAWDQVPKSGSPVIELYAEDGSSFLKQVDMHGYLMNYWQYSFVVPRRPVRFEENEIIYTMQNPRAGSPYGYSPFESVVNALLFLEKAMNYNEHFYENSAIPPLQIDYPWVKNKEELEEIGKYIENTFMGPDKSFRTLITNGGTVAKAINIDPQKLQMLEMQEFYLKLILAKLKTPPEILGLQIGTKSAMGGGGAAAEMQNVIHKSRAIKPLIKLVEHDWTQKVLPAILNLPPSQCYVKFAWDTMTDLEEQERQAHIDQVYSTTGKITINEIRQRDGEDPVPWGYKPYNPQLGLLGGDTPQNIGYYPIGKGGGGSSDSNNNPFGGMGGAGSGGGLPGGSSNRGEESGKAASGAKTLDQYSTVPQSTMQHSIAGAPNEGRGPNEIGGGEFKALDHTALAIRRGFREILKEEYDQLQDHKSFDDIASGLVDKAQTVLNYHISSNTSAAQERKTQALKDFRATMSDMAMDFKAGKLK
jgi:hypothetical protein